MTKIKVRLKCTNIAPLVNLDNEFENNSLKIGVFANNGCGKTFISRMFRLLEKSLDDSNVDASVSNTDRLITMGKTSASFGFRITNDAGAVVEDITINLAKSIVPTVTTTNYLYHTFNQDYVDENIRALDYEHTEDVQGYILGKTNIDLTEDNKTLNGIIDARVTLKNDITAKIDAYINKYVAGIANIKRLAEYSQFVSADVFLTHGDSRKSDLPKGVNDYIKDFDKVKSVPENLDDISKIYRFEFSEEQFSEIKTILETAYTLSSFGEEFKAEMKEKQEFVEKGLELVKTSEGRCPFCKQKMDSDSLSLIDRYNDFLTNEEAKTIKRIQLLIQIIESKRKELGGVKTKNEAAINQYNEYKTKYIPSCENNNLAKLNVALVDDYLTTIKRALEEKHKDISSVVPIGEHLTDLKFRINALNDLVESNNSLINDINWKKNSIGEENKNIRRNICKAAYNQWVEKYNKEQKQYVEYGKQI